MQLKSLDCVPLFRQPSGHSGQPFEAAIPRMVLGGLKAQRLITGHDLAAKGQWGIDYYR
jgi:hypothetical protein